jgi:hypothetical protein
VPPFTAIQEYSIAGLRIGAPSLEVMKRLKSYYSSQIKIEVEKFHTITESWFVEHLFSSGATRPTSELTAPLESVLPTLVHACPLMTAAVRAISSVPEFGKLEDYKEPVRVGFLNMCATGRRGSTGRHGAFVDVLTELWKGKGTSSSTIQLLTVFGYASTIKTWLKSDGKWMQGRRILDLGYAFFVIDNGQLVVKVARASTATGTARKNKRMHVVTALRIFLAFVSPVGFGTLGNYVDLNLLRHENALHDVYLNSSIKDTLLQLSLTNPLSPIDGKVKVTPGSTTPAKETQVLNVMQMIQYIKGLRRTVEYVKMAETLGSGVVLPVPRRVVDAFVALGDKVKRWYRDGASETMLYSAIGRRITPLVDQLEDQATYPGEVFDKDPDTLAGCLGMLGILTTSSPTVTHGVADATGDCDEGLEGADADFQTNIRFRQAHHAAVQGALSTNFGGDVSAAVRNYHSQTSARIFRSAEMLEAGAANREDVTLQDRLSATALNRARSSAQLSLMAEHDPEAWRLEAAPAETVPQLDSDQRPTNTPIPQPPVSKLSPAPAARAENISLLRLLRRVQDMEKLHDIGTSDEKGAAAAPAAQLGAFSVHE